MQAVEKSRATQKTIQLISMPQQKPFIFAVPIAPLKFKDQQNMTKNFVIVGPYLRTSNSNLMLMQNFNGKMYLRDEYEKFHKIERDVKTRCIWIYADTLKCIQNVQIEPMYFSWKKTDNRFPEKKGSLENGREGEESSSHKTIAEKKTIVEKKSDPVDKEQGLKISSIIGGFQEDRY